MFPTLGYADSVAEAVDGADVTIVLTEWQEFIDIDPIALGGIVNQQTVIDARNCLPATEWSKAGWTVHAMGRVPEVAALADDLAELAPLR
jgi:UDPglucose 6-dehydrogenase